MDYWEKADYSWSDDSKRHILTPSSKSRTLFYYIQEIGQFKASRPYYTERAHLPSYLIKFTLNGTGELRYRYHTYSLQRGDLFFIDCRDYQYYQATSEEPWEMDWIHFEGGNSGAFFQEFMKNGSPVFSTNQLPEDNPIHLIIQQLLQLQDLQHAQTDYQSSVLIHQLLNELLLQKYRQDFTYETIPSLVLEMKAYIDQHFKETISLEDLAQLFHLNKYQLTKEFSKYIGLPPIKYQISKKISYSKDLLRYSNQTMKEIAVDVGLENYAYFSRLFKKRTGLTPSQYRKSGF